MNMATTTLHELQHFPCTACGAKLEFNPKAGRLKCPYCGHEEAVPENPDELIEIPYEDYLATRKVQTTLLSETALEVACPGCRARITFQPPDVAGNCPFCGTSIVAKGEKAHPVVTPNGILPCKIPQKEARDRIRAWMGNNWFVPSSLKKIAQQEGLQGIYLPFWTYDSQTDTAYNGQRGDYYYTTETYTTTNSEGETVTETREVRHTAWHPVSGQVDRWFDDILIPATTQLTEKQLKRLAPWQLQDCVPYDPAYLASFKAQRYQVPLEAGLERAKTEMGQVITHDVRHDIGGDEQQITHLQTDYSDITFKHVLLPVWLSAYRYNNRQYQVMVNAQTGQVYGKRPYSAGKIAIAVVAGIAVAAGIIFLFTQGKSKSRTYFRPRIEYRPDQPHPNRSYQPRSTPRQNTPLRSTFNSPLQSHPQYAAPLPPLPSLLTASLPAASLPLLMIPTFPESVGHVPRFSVTIATEQKRKDKTFKWKKL
ncbi:MAG: hypothetical protein VKJ24_14785 [Synechococcales bacterium]|nr:hypothetical protein [Synechococcales bacterium]